MSLYVTEYPTSLLFLLKMTRQINEIADQLARNMQEICEKKEQFDTKKYAAILYGNKFIFINLLIHDC